MATMNRGRWGSTTGRFGEKSSYGHGTTGRSTGATIPAKYKTVSNSFAAKINSYKMLYNQTCGAAKCTRPTTTTLNTFANWINKGAVVQCCTKTQVVRWANASNVNFNSRTPTIASCKNVLAKKFGKATIKAVAQTKTGGFMVATSPTWNGKPFCFPKKG